MIEQPGRTSNRSPRLLYFVYSPSEHCVPEGHRVPLGCVGHTAPEFNPATLGRLRTDRMLAGCLAAPPGACVSVLGGYRPSRPRSSPNRFSGGRPEREIDPSGLYRIELEFRRP